MQLPAPPTGLSLSRTVQVPLLLPDGRKPVLVLDVIVEAMTMSKLVFILANVRCESPDLPRWRREVNTTASERIPAVLLSPNMLTEMCEAAIPSLVKMAASFFGEQMMLAGRDTLTEVAPPEPSAPS
jgi:hypothetical protein